MKAIKRAYVLTDESRELIKEKVTAELERHQEVVFAYLHGSFLEGFSHDIDIALYLAPGAVAQDCLRGYETDLSSKLQGSVGMPVDVRVLNDAPLSFRYHVSKGSPLVVRDPGLLDEWRARTWDVYLDYAPFARRYLREVLCE